jgi:hypothetical protein
MDNMRGFTRRRFLGGMALLGLTPVYSRVAAALPPFTPEKRWTGDDFDEGHRIMRNAQALVRNTKDWERHAGTYDAIIVGGGISGLTVAYKLRERNILLLEREPQTGGVSKSDNWNGIEYSLGAAYVIDPDPESEDPRERENYELLHELGLRDAKEEIDTEKGKGKDRRLAGDLNHCVFTNRALVPEEAVYSHQNVEFFKHVLEEGPYPNIPPTNPELVQKLDSVSFRQFIRDPKLQQEIYGKQLGAITPAGSEAIEYYFWGAFGCNSWETSAYHGLNFFAAEFGRILVFPGGNAFVARRLDERIRQRKPDIIQTGHWVLSIEPEKEKGGYSVLAYRDNKIHHYRAKAVVFSAPLFLARKMVPGLPDEQQRVIESLDYRSFVVANVLLRRRMDQIFAKEEAFARSYELTRVHDVDVTRYQPDVLSTEKVFSDVVVGDFAVWRHSTHAVLTVYRPYPYSYGRDRLRFLTYDAVEAEVRRAVLEGFAQHGLRESDIEGIRLSRWGHPMIIPRPGQLADGIMRKATQAPPGLFFAHTDIQGAPAFENAMASAQHAVEGLRKYLG